MSDHDELTRLPVPCLVVLVGPSSVGKSTWAAAHFAADEIVSSDRLRAVVGYAEDDLDATEQRSPSSTRSSITACGAG